MTDNAVAFESTLASFGNNTGIEVPPELLEQLGAGKRPPVLVELNGYEYRSTVGTMAGLSNSLQRYHVDTIGAAKSADTRARRVGKAVELFLAGKQR